MIPQSARAECESSSSINRRRAIVSTLTATAAVAASAGGSPPGSAPVAQTATPDPRESSPRAYRMKKSINLWAFPYPSADEPS